ncbi:MAG: autotransporter-associated beta strand repeat-containing protein [Chthoniobacterales bacterium]
MTLSGANTYTGATEITEGTLVLGATGSILSDEIKFTVTDISSGLLSVENAPSASLTPWP